MAREGARALNRPRGDGATGSIDHTESSDTLAPQLPAYRGSAGSGANDARDQEGRPRVQRLISTCHEISGPSQRPSPSSHGVRKASGDGPAVIAVSDDLRLE